jgi:hypothetical protein
MLGLVEKSLDFQAFLKKKQLFHKMLDMVKKYRYKVCFYRTAATNSRICQVWDELRLFS